MGSVPDSIFKIASKVSSPYALAAFAIAAVVALILIMSNKPKSKTIPALAWITLIAVVAIPIAGKVITANVPQGTYRVMVVVVDPEGQVVADARVTPSVGGQEKRTDNGVEFEIPATSVPENETVTFFADKGHMTGSEKVRLSATRAVSVTIGLLRTSATTTPSPQAKASPTGPLIKIPIPAAGVFVVRVVDPDGHPVPYAKVSCIGKSDPQDPADEKGEFPCPISPNTLSIAISAKAPNGDDGFKTFDVNQEDHTLKLRHSH